MKFWIQNYINAQQAALNSVSQIAIEKLIGTLQTAWREERQVFIAGNGGSASNASHFATDLGKGASDKLGKRFRVLSLTDNVSWITALGNDYAYDEIFSRQLANYGRAGDLLLTVSVSGNSPNLVKALEWANANGMETAAVVGANRGRMAELAHQVLVVGDTHYGRVEDVQMHILHMLCYAFMELPDLSK
jgi:D-sedoheptulose 7-phosphate isomerase